MSGDDKKVIDVLINDVRTIREDVTSIKEVLARNTEILSRNTKDVEHHIKRTALLEEAMGTALLPIKAGKLLAQIIVGAGAVYGALKAIGLL